MPVFPIRGPAPPPAQCNHPLPPVAPLERAAEMEKVVLPPYRLDEDECRRVLERRTGLAIPRKAIRQSALHDICPVHEPAVRGEVRADADQLGVIAVRVTGAIIQRHIPQLARADAGSVLRPRP